MARFVAVLSGKGGVGKTSVAVNLGYALHKLGVDTVVLEGNLSSPNLSSFLSNSHFPISLHTVMTGFHPIDSAVHTHESGLRFVPADTAVDAIRLVDFDNLHSAVQDLHLTSDVVLVDGCSGLSRETGKILDFCDEVLVVTNGDEVSVSDARRVIDLSKRLKKGVSGVVLNKHQKSSSVLSDSFIERFLGVPIVSKIPFDDRFSNAISKKSPFAHMFPRSSAAKEFHNFAYKFNY